MKHKGQLKGFPDEVVQKMLYYQVQQGNKEDVSVFEKNKTRDGGHGGITWSDTPEGAEFWYEVINENFKLFFQKYPKKSNLTNQNNNNKIYYVPNKVQVEIGDMIEINDIQLVLTDQIVKDNPDLFEVQEQNNFQNNIKKQYLLQEIRTMYPKGTKFINMNTGIVQVVCSYAYIHSDEIRVEAIRPLNLMRKSNPCVYKQGRFAEIIPPLFTTQDGVDRYIGDLFYRYDSSTGVISKHLATIPIENTENIFSTEGMAEDHAWRCADVETIANLEYIKTFIEFTPDYEITRKSLIDIARKYTIKAK